MVQTSRDQPFPTVLLSKSSLLGDRLRNTSKVDVHAFRWHTFVQDRLIRKAGLLVTVRVCSFLIFFGFLSRLLRL